VRPGKRFGFTAVEKSDIWRRWKAGQSLHEIGAPLTSHTAAFGVCCYLAEGFLPLPGGARASRSLSLSVKTYREGLLPGLRYGRLLDD
jgi:hypothetical protein